MNRVARFFWTLAGTAAMQKGPLWWAGHHVYHHKYADRDGDPHSPKMSGFYHAHFGWFLNDSRYKSLAPVQPRRPGLRQRARDRLARAVLLPAAAGAGAGDVRDRRMGLADLGLLPADDDAGARDLCDQHGEPPVRVAPVPDPGRLHATTR